MAGSRDSSGGTPSDRVVVAGLLVFGVYLVGIALFGVVAPNAFFEELGRFGPRNDHYIHDVSAFQGAAGVLLLLALRLRSWRAPALTLAALQSGLHTISHAVDLSEARPEWVGVAELVGLGVSTAVLAWLVARAVRHPLQPG